jgi:hypothetical protein
MTRTTTTSKSKAKGSGTSHARKAKKPNSKTVYIATESEYAEEYEDAKREVEKLDMRLKARSDDALLLAQRDQAWERLDTAEKALRNNCIKFVLRAIGHKNYDQLASDHPVSAEFKAEIEEAGGEIDTFPWNPETFPTALIAKSLVDEEGEFGSEDEIIEYLNGPEWNSAEISALFTAALEANTSRKIVDMGNGSRPIRR